MSVLERVRATGKYPPSLLQDGSVTGDDGFEAAVMKVLDANGTSVRCAFVRASVRAFVCSCLCHHDYCTGEPL